MNAQRPTRSADEVQDAALADWEAVEHDDTKISEDFASKQRDPDRDISDAEIERILKSSATRISQYTHNGEPRYGFWHPESQVFIGWRPDEMGYDSQFKTCFVRLDGEKYMEKCEDHRWIS